MLSGVAQALVALIGLTGAVNLSVSSKAGNKTSPIQYGVMFEDINYCGDGGIYAELIRNRAFQATNASAVSTDPWKGVHGSKIKAGTANPLSKETKYYVTVKPGKSAKAGLSNPGWWGIDVQPQTYTGSFWTRGAYKGRFTASLENKHETLAMTHIPHTKTSDTKGEWSEYTYTLKPTKAAPNVNNSLVISFTSSGASDGSLDFTILSLFPPTYNNRPNGNRPDLMTALKELSPSFLRLPGGNNLEGNGPAESSPRWNWRKTVGPLYERPGRLGTWGYYNTDGLGLAEYLDWCEDLSMEPILAVWDGHFLDGTNIPEAKLQRYVKDVMNELEYIMGPTTSKFGALRAKHGRTKPWKINYVEVGNEDNLSSGEASYKRYRFNAFYTAIHKKYPSIRIIASTIDIQIPQDQSGDFHLYARPDQLVQSFNMFDNFNDTTGTSALIGEYSSLEPNDAGNSPVSFGADQAPAPFWVGSVAEAVFLIGIEKNARNTLGASYAPTFQNTNGYQWTPDMISFDALQANTVKSTSHSMISLLSGTRIGETRTVTGAKQGPVYYVAGTNAQNANQFVMKAAVYNATQTEPVNVKFEGLKKGAKGSLTMLTAPDPYSTAAVGSDPVMMKTKSLTAGKEGGFRFMLPNYSVAVLRTM